MGQTGSTGVGQVAPPSTHAKDTRRGSPNNSHKVRNVNLVWLDANINKSTNDCQNTITYLRRTVNNIHIFTDSQECLQFLADMANEKTSIVISGSLGQQVMPRVHNLSQVDSIFIFCSNKNYHEGWVKDWPKIKGVFTEIKSVCDALKQVPQQSRSKLNSRLLSESI